VGGLKGIEKRVGSWRKKAKVKPMDCVPWVSCFCMMRVKKKNPPSAVGGLEAIVDGEMLFESH